MKSKIRACSGSSGSDCGWVDYFQGGGWQPFPPPDVLAQAVDSDPSYSTYGHPYYWFSQPKPGVIPAFHIPFFSGLRPFCRPSIQAATFFVKCGSWSVKREVAAVGRGGTLPERGRRIQRDGGNMQRTGPAAAFS